MIGHADLDARRRQALFFGDLPELQGVA